MLLKNIKKDLEKQGYRFIGNHSAVKICPWTKKDLLDGSKCYKSVFYGVHSYSCCQISPWIACENKCIHCWRAIELDMNKLIDKQKIDKPNEIIEGCIKQQRKLLSGFKGNSRVNKKKLKEAQEPMQVAISLVGEPTLYSKIGELIKELRKQRKTSFLVTNGLSPRVLEKLNKNKQLPTQLYLSLNSPNKKLYNKWHNSKTKNAWKKFNATLSIFPKLKTRKVIRMTLVKGMNSNMEDEFIEDYSKLIKKANPNFIEVKGYKAVGFARYRKGMDYNSMPTHKEIKYFAKKIAKSLENENYKILDEHEFSCVVLIGKNKKMMKIKKKEI